MIASFPRIVKSILQQLCPHDYPVLNSRLFFEIWLTFVLDQSLTSMRDVFYRLNKTGIPVDISTFSKACKTRKDQHFCRIYAELAKQVKRKNPATAQMLFLIDSTVITLRGFASWEFLEQLSQTKTLFVVPIKNNMKTEFEHTRYRVVGSCDLESQTEFR
jgi:putative transposase